MRWEDMRRSQNVEDRRGRSAARGGAQLGIGGMILVAIISFAMGKNPLEILGMIQGMQGQPTSQQRQVAPPKNDQASDFIKAVLGDTEETWQAIFQKQGQRYKEPRLVLFTGQVQSACGFQSSAVGPFYCPPDQQVYLDLSFFRDLANKMNAPGDFAQAYVIAHEVGHHIQTITGISQRVQQKKAGVDEVEANQLSVRQELQADCFAGVWGHFAQKKNLLDPGDLEEALKAATEIGDDRLQMKARGTIVPESFTHGSSEQRVRWFRTGMQSGRMEACDTFSASNL